jgi:selenide, water dikinase
MIAVMEVAGTHVLDSPVLTALSHAGGCGRKLAATELLPLIRGLAVQRDPRLLVGASTRDDAAVFLLRDDLALVQTVDFFTPLVDDPYDFGRIAAANALSDVYAMGGAPLTAMNIVGFPLRDLGRAVLEEILRGGQMWSLGQARSWWVGTRSTTASRSTGLP